MVASELATGFSGFSWLGPIVGPVGTAANAVGASVPSARELDSETVARARLFVDRRESALAEAGDFLIPRGEGKVGRRPYPGRAGRGAPGPAARPPISEEMTVFKSLGLAVEDLAAARLVYARAVDRRRNLGGAGRGAAPKSLTS